MAKIKAPLFSLDAAGTLDKNITYKKKHQNNIAQKYSQPGANNPFESSPRQKDQRSIIRLVTIHWQCMSAGDKLSWNNAAKDARFKGTGYHYFLSKAQQNLTQYLGLVGYWSMNYNIDDKIPDLSGNCNHGTLSPIYPCDSPTLVDSFDKKHGKAASFNGVSTHLKAANLNSLNISKGTVFLYLKRFNVTTGDEQFFHIYHNPWEDYLTLRLWGGHFLLYIKKDNNFICQLQSTYTLDQSKFVSFCVTQDGSGITFYLNGLEISSSGTNTNLFFSTYSPLSFTIGKSAWKYFKGLIDDFLIYKDSLPPDEIKMLSSL